MRVAQEVRLKFVHEFELHEHADNVPTVCGHQLGAQLAGKQLAHVSDSASSPSFSFHSRGGFPINAQSVSPGLSDDARADSSVLRASW